LRRQLDEIKEKNDLTRNNAVDKKLLVNTIENLSLDQTQAVNKNSFNLLNKKRKKESQIDLENWRTL